LFNNLMLGQPEKSEGTQLKERFIFVTKLVNSILTNALDQSPS